MDTSDFVEQASNDVNDAIAMMAEAKERAMSVREAWTTSVANGEQSFDSLMDLVNRPGSKEGQYASKIKLYDILRQAKGWTDDRAYKAMVENGMDHKTTVGEARLYIPFYERFRSLIKADGEKWEPTLEREVIRPEMPEGWPWYSKLDGLMALDGADAYPLPSSVKAGRSRAQETPSKPRQEQDVVVPTEYKDSAVNEPQKAIEESSIESDNSHSSSLIDEMKRSIQKDDDEFDYDAAMMSLIDDTDDEDDDPTDDLARMLGV